MSNTIEVNSASGSYEVSIGNGILESELSNTLSPYQKDDLFVFIDENVNDFHGEKIERYLKRLFKNVNIFIVPEGESSKSISVWEKCVSFLLEHGIRRNSPVVVMGGGITGDVGGFAAASVLRGVPLIQVPTSLLAMVDSSVGGKTGINHSMGKNLVGAFYQPKRVIADIELLQTLPSREWINGLSEILKYGAIKDATIFADSDLFLKDDFKKSSPEDLIRLISKCVQVKADIVKADEFEGGIRAFLNFGHTFAHALERACGYEKISHGEAVFLGMLAAFKLSKLTGGDISENPIAKFSSLYSYRVSKDELSYNELIRNMNSDKKRIGSSIRFVLLESLQHPVLKTVTDDKLIHQAWEVAFNEL